MPNPKGISRRPPKAVLENLVKTYRANGCNVSATARELSMDRVTCRFHLQYARDEGIIGGDELAKKSESVNYDAFLSAMERKAAAFQKMRQIGPWDKPITIRMPDRPYIIVAMGDPHLDAPGCNVKEFERHWSAMDPSNNVFGVCVGDWFDNWPRVLAHIWKDNPTDPHDAWTMFVYLVETYGEGLLGACSGNHDDWSHGPVDPVAWLLEQNNVAYRKGAVRLALKSGSNEPVMVSIRHKWKYSSKHSPAHGQRIAAQEGWGDHLMIGGHTHKDEVREHVHPRTGAISNLIQVSSFKEFDDFPDTLGLMPHRIQPAVYCVIDPRREDSDPDKVVIVRDGDMARKMLAAI
jgi:hypothetical protein